jgi:hypothetical protein
MREAHRLCEITSWPDRGRRSDAWCVKNNDSSLIEPIAAA